MTIGLYILALAVTIQSIIVEPPIVTTPYGKLRGKYYTVPGKCTAELYRRIPYAKPPIGEFRWKKPQEWTEKWKDERDASFIGPACAEGSTDQFPKGGYSEDCLHINVYTSTECRKKSCPVVYYMHGGGQLWDSSVLFPDDYLVKNFVAHDVILVTVGYRMSMFGTLALGDENLLPANLALHDAIAGLKFTREIIDLFGGDKDRITIMGHSGGAGMVMNIAFSPGISPPEKPLLFKSAIAMSGTAVLRHEDDHIAKTRKYASYMKCYGSSEEIMACLRTKTTLELCQTQYNISGDDVFHPAQLGGIALAGELFPIRNNYDFFDQPAKFRYMTGTILREVDGVTKHGNSDAYQYDAFLNPAEVMEKNEEDKAQGKGYFNHTQLSVQLFTDTWRTAAAEVEKAGGETYLYEYEYRRHSGHAADLSYIIGIHGFERDENEEWLAQVYPVYFANFAKEMAPAPDWTPLDTKKMNFYAINKSIDGTISPKMKEDYHRDLLDYWAGEIVDYDHSVTLQKIKLINQPVQYHKLFLSPKARESELHHTMSDIWNFISSPKFIMFAIGCVILISAGFCIGRCSKKTYSCERQPLLQHKIY